MNKKIFLTGCALGAALMLPAENLVKNGNFEEHLKGWTIPGWIKNVATPQFDSSDMPGPGRASLKMVAENGKLPIIYQYFKFVPGATKYKVSFNAKTKDFSNWGWFMIHIESQKTRKRYYSQTVGAQGGTNNSRPWKNYSQTIEVPAAEAGNTATLTIVFGGKTTGTAWIDDLMVEPIMEAAADAKKAEAAKASAKEQKKK